MSEETDDPVPEENKEDFSDDKKKEKLAAKFSLISGEEVLIATKPSVFAFFSMYVLAVVVGLVHYSFNALSLMDDPENSIAAFLKGMIDTDIGRAIGFPILIMLVAWFNRWVNISTSGRWYTSSLILIALFPFLLAMNGLIGDWFFDDGEYPLSFLPDSYAYELMGIVWAIVLILFTTHYTRSFNYAVTSDGIIFKRQFLMTRSQRRMLYDNITEVNLSQGPIGTMLRFGSVLPMTASGLGLGDESVGISAAAGMAPAVDDNDNAATVATKGLFKLIFGLLTAQRTIRSLRPDPSNCFYNISKPDVVKHMINEMHKEKSQSSQLGELKDLLAQSLDKKEDD
jgi:membrane protein YdbS with pleckstrin-like domain